MFHYITKSTTLIQVPLSKLLRSITQYFGLPMVLFHNLIMLLESLENKEEQTTVYYGASLFQSKPVENEFQHADGSPKVYYADGTLAPSFWRGKAGWIGEVLGFVIAIPIGAVLGFSVYLIDSVVKGVHFLQQSLYDTFDKFAAFVLSEESRAEFTKDFYLINSQSYLAKSFNVGSVILGSLLAVIPYIPAKLIEFCIPPLAGYLTKPILSISGRIGGSLLSAAALVLYPAIQLLKGVLQLSSVIREKIKYSVAFLYVKLGVMPNGMRRVEGFQYGNGIYYQVNEFHSEEFYAQVKALFEGDNSWAGVFLNHFSIFAYLIKGSTLVQVLLSKLLRTITQIVGSPMDAVVDFCCTTSDSKATETHYANKMQVVHYADGAKAPGFWRGIFGWIGEAAGFVIGLPVGLGLGLAAYAIDTLFQGCQFLQQTLANAFQVLSKSGDLGKDITTAASWTFFPLTYVVNKMMDLGSFIQERVKYSVAFIYAKLEIKPAVHQKDPAGSGFGSLFGLNLGLEYYLANETMHSSTFRQEVAALGSSSWTRFLLGPLKKEEAPLIASGSSEESLFIASAPSEESPLYPSPLSSVPTNLYKEGIPPAELLYQ